MLVLAGLPGQMSMAVAQAAQRKEVPLAPFGFGRSTRNIPWSGASEGVMPLLGPAERHELAPLPGAVVIDFTTPRAALDQVRWYCHRGWPFVMGTTGFDPEQARLMVERSSIPAVIAPNMAVPIVLIQSLLADAAQRYPGALQGYQLSITESHQSTKKDVSGTAKVLLPSFLQLGLDTSGDGIRSIREPRIQRNELGVPQEHLAGHAWHAYVATSPDHSTQLELSHRVCGRGVYADGAILAARFLARKVTQGVQGRVFSMVDVLQDLA